MYYQIFVIRWCNEMRRLWFSVKKLWTITKKQHTLTKTQRSKQRIFDLWEEEKHIYVKIFPHLLSRSRHPLLVELHLRWFRSTPCRHHCPIQPEKGNLKDPKSESEHHVGNIDSSTHLGTKISTKRKQQFTPSYKGGGRFPAVFPVSWFMNCFVNSSADPAIPALFASKRFPHLSDPGPETFGLNIDNFCCLGLISPQSPPSPL